MGAGLGSAWFVELMAGSSHPRQVGKGSKATTEWGQSTLIVHGKQDQGAALEVWALRVKVQM